MKEDKSQVPANDKTHEVSADDAAKMTPENNDDKGTYKPEEHKELKHSSVASINAIITSATGAVRSRMHTDTLANTGTNTSYEGATSNAAGGTGYNSGQSATGETTRTTSGYDAAGLGNHEKQSEESDETNENEKDT
jgi:hypothetical protein